MPFADEETETPHPLEELIYFYQLDEIKAWLTKYPEDLNRQFHTLCTGTPLMLACMHGWIDLALYLLQQPNIDVTADDVLGNTALHYAVSHPNLIAVNLRIISKNPLLQFKTNTTQKQQSLLRTAIKFGNRPLVINILRIIFSNQYTKPSLSDSEIISILQKEWQEENGLFECARVSVDRGMLQYLQTIAANPAYINFRGSIVSKNIYVCIDDTNVSVDTLRKQLAYASLQDINYLDDALYTPIMLAIINADLDKISALLDTMGVDLTLKCNRDNNPLVIAIGCCAEVYAYLKEAHIKEDKIANTQKAKERIAVIQQLINFGADLNAPIFGGVNGYMLIAQQELIDLLKIAPTMQTINFAAVDDNGNNVLHRAIILQQPVVIKILVDMNAVDIFTINNSYLTPLGAMCLYTASINRGTPTGRLTHKKCTEILNIMLQRIPKPGQLTPLHITLMHQCYDLAERIMHDHPEYIYAKDDIHLTTLHTIAISGNISWYKKWSKLDFDLFATTLYGENCLHLASFAGKLAMVQQLVNDNFDVSLKVTDGTHKGKTALDIARVSKNDEVVKYLSSIAEKKSSKSKPNKPTP